MEAQSIPDSHKGPLCILLNRLLTLHPPSNTDTLEVPEMPLSTHHLLQFLFLDGPSFSCPSMGNALILETQLWASLGGSLPRLTQAQLLD